MSDQRSSIPGSPALHAESLSAGGASEHSRRQAEAYTPEQAAQDRVLVERIRAGQRSGASREESDDARLAMAHLIDRFQGRVYAVCVRMVGRPGDSAHDLAQDALLKVIQGLETFDGRARLSTWIIRVTINTCLTYLRSTRVRRHASLDVASRAGIAGSLVRDVGVRLPSGGSVKDRELSPVQSVQQQEQERRVLRALAALDPEQRAVLVLRDAQGLEYEQIAAALEIAVGTVKSRLFRARLALRDGLEGTGSE